MSDREEMEDIPVHIQEFLTWWKEEQEMFASPADIEIVELGASSLTLRSTIDEAWPW